MIKKNGKEDNLFERKVKVKKVTTGIIILRVIDWCLIIALIVLVFVAKDQGVYDEVRFEIECKEVDGELVPVNPLLLQQMMQSSLIDIKDKNEKERNKDA